MHQQSLTTWAAVFGTRFEQWMPRRIDNAWLTRFVDVPRFGWDLDTLQSGFVDPLYRFVDAQAIEPAGGGHALMRHLRPALACRMVAALTEGRMSAEDILRFDGEMTALELHVLSSMMLDHLDNGRNLAASTGAERELALPVLITVAYSARQLAASMLWRHGALPEERRLALAQRFSRLLFLQGIGHTLDLRGGERQLRHGGEQALAEHLHWYLTPLDFELVCETAAAAAGLSGEATAMLAATGAEAGLAWHCGRLLAALENGPPPAGRRLDQPVRWAGLAEGDLQGALARIGERARSATLASARRLGSALEEVFGDLLAPSHASPVIPHDNEVTA